MGWSERVMADLDARADVVHTARGDVQLAMEGDGTPVLAIHGGPGGFDQGLAWCGHLSAGGCQVLAVSRPGYLRTPLGSGPRPEDQADLYAALLDTLGIERAAVLAFSTGGPSAVHFAARHPDRTVALFLDTAILQSFEPPIGRLRRAVFESSPIVWLSSQMVTRWPRPTARFMIDGVSQGLSTEQKKAAVDWITSDPARLASMQEQFQSIAPRRYRKAGWANDLVNERHLAPLPFAAVVASTLIAVGTHDAIVPLEHATHAADTIAAAELLPVEEGHHILSLSRNYGPVAARQLELVGLG